MAGRLLDQRRYLQGIKVTRWWGRRGYHSYKGQYTAWRVVLEPRGNFYMTGDNYKVWVAGSFWGEEEISLRR